ncbi:MAG: hypothetical protein GY922_09260, partial [Proteobacteria bacterium]|nr:hypothetical protein [Pseudomonadota bacterium]
MRRITANWIKKLKVTGKRYTVREDNIEITVGAPGSISVSFYFKNPIRGTGRAPLLKLLPGEAVTPERVENANARLAEMRHDLALGVTPFVRGKKIKAASVRVTAAKVIERKNAPTVARLVRDYEAVHLPTLKHDTRRN